MIYDILLDIGGTGIKAGFFSVENKYISDFYNFEALSSESKDLIINQFVNICNIIWDKIDNNKKKIRSIKMAFPGPFDYKNGISKMRGISKYESLFQVSIPIEMINFSKAKNVEFIPNKIEDFVFINDVESYSLGCIDKYKLFEGNRVFYICIGTGAGSAYSIDGDISTDINEGIAHNGWIYSTLYKDSIIDDYISSRGIIKLSKKYFGEPISPLDLSKMVRDGDQVAKKVYEEFEDNLNGAIFPLISKFKGNKLVLGGNISNSSELFIGKIKKRCIESKVDIIVESNTSKMAMIGLCKL